MSRVRSRCRAAAALMAALAVLLACASADHASDTATGKITPSPKLVEAVKSGEMTMTAFTAAPVDADLGDLMSGSADASAPAATSTPITKSKSVTTAPAASSTAVSAPKPSSTGETAVDTFQSKTGLADPKSNSSGTMLAVAGVIGCVAAVAMAVVYKRKTQHSAAADDDSNDSNASQPQHQSHTTTCAFENADYTPNHESIDAMLQDDRTMAESIAMMPVFSAADRMDMSGGIVRLSSPFGASGVRISSPGGRGPSSTDDFAFNVDTKSQQSAGAAHVAVDVKPAGWL